jgi:peptidoglycan/LPS O-acetylase OafA/YrhL
LKKKQEEEPKPATAHYRPDIDGLRALAVVAVVVFHAFPQALPGGFTGVDIFFVVSGFLISTILMEGLEQGKFSIRDFYSRRVRRIFPALIVVLVASYALGWFLLLAGEFEQFGKHVAGAAGFASNLLLWTESGYFDNASDTKPLLHLWSLGVEEQFYLLWPPILWAAWKLRTNFLLAIGVIAVPAFISNIYLARHDPSAAFYWPVSRFWELLIGAGLAWVELRRRKIATAVPPPLAANRPVKTLLVKRPLRLSWRRSILSLAGLALAGAGLVLVADQKSFGGLWALAPALGAAMLIGAGPNAIVNRTLLSHPGIVAIGLISYPLYLWHWPLLSIARVVAGEQPTAVFRGLAVLASLLLATATYRWIEQPLRHHKQAGVVAAGLAVCMALVGVAGYATFRSGGFASRSAVKPVSLHAGAIDHLTFHTYASKKYFPCTPEDVRKGALEFHGELRCLQSKNDRPIDIALVGDSHAEHMFPGLAEQFPDRNIVSYVKITLPILSNKDYADSFRFLLGNPSIKIVVLSAYWFAKRTWVPEISSLEQELSATVVALRAAGKKVYIPDDVPGFDFDPSQCKYSRVLSRKSNCTVAYSVFQERYQTYHSALKAVEARFDNVKVLDIARYFCDSKSCSMARGGEIHYRDRDHLNLEGSRYLARRLAEDYPDAFTISR